MLTCTCIFMCVHAYGSQRITLVAILRKAILVLWGRVSHWPGVINRLSWLASEPRGPPVSVLCTGITNTHRDLYFYVGLGAWTQTLRFPSKQLPMSHFPTDPNTEYSYQSIVSVYEEAPPTMSRAVAIKQTEGNLATVNLEWNLARNQWHQLLGTWGKGKEATPAPPVMATEHPQ